MILAIFLLLSRTYHPVLLAELSKTIWTHVQTSGTVTLVKKEADGDIHIRLDDDKGHFIVAEIIPAIPLPAPKKGTCIVVKGISRKDSDHKWFEVHPVEAWAPCAK